MFIVSARTRRITACNKAAERIFGYSSAELVGRTTEVLHPDTQSFEGFSESMKHVAARTGVIVSRRSMRRRDGSELQARDRIVSIDTANQADLVMWLIREYSESGVPIRSEIIERDLLRMATSTSPGTDQWTAILERFALECDWDYAEAWLPRSGHLALTAWWSVNRAPGMEQFTEISQSINFGPGEGLPGRVWRSGDIEWLNDINDKPESVFRRSFIARSAGLRSWFSVPVRNSDRITHVLLFARRAPRRPDHDVVALTEEACCGIGTAAAPSALD